MKIGDAVQALAGFLRFVFVAARTTIRDTELRIVGGDNSLFVDFLRPPAQVRHAVFSVPMDKPSACL